VGKEEFAGDIGMKIAFRPSADFHGLSIRRDDGADRFGAASGWACTCSRARCLRELRGLRGVEDLWKQVSRGGRGRTGRLALPDGRGFFFTVDASANIGFLFSFTKKYPRTSASEDASAAGD